MVLLASVVHSDTGVGVDTGVDTMMTLVSVSVLVSEHFGVGVGVGVGTLRCRKFCWCRSTPAIFFPQCLIYIFYIIIVLHFAKHSDTTTYNIEAPTTVTVPLYAFHTW